VGVETSGKKTGALIGGNHNRVHCLQFETSNQFTKKTKGEEQERRFEKSGTRVFIPQRVPRGPKGEGTLRNRRHDKKKDWTFAPQVKGSLLKKKDADQGGLLPGLRL